MATKTVYKIRVNYTEASGYANATFTYDTKEMRDSAFLAFVERNRFSKDVQHIEAIEQEAEVGLVLETVFMAALISGEFHKQVMTKGLIDSVQAAQLITEVAVECFKALEGKLFSAGQEPKTMEENIISWAKTHIFEKHNIKI